MKVLGVCGGNGVILHPFKNHLVGNIEMRALFHTKLQEQWEANFPGIPLTKDHQSFMQPKLFDDLSNLDVIIGAPDCGHSSMLAYSRAKKLSDAKKNESLILFINSVIYYLPKVFLMENLPKLFLSLSEEDCKIAFKDYDLVFHKLSVSELGNSQKNRIRLLIIGIRKDLKEELKEKLQYQFNNIYKVSKLKTAGELIYGLEKENWKTGNVREDINDIITIYAGTKSSLQDLKLFWDSNPRLSRYVVSDRKFTTAPGVYRNISKNHPATARKANRQFNHLGLQLTPRELARIQGVPDRFKIYIDPNNLGYWINKGRTTVTKTPPYEIGYWFYKQIKNVI